jgi:signal peptide peptidase SppA
MSDFTFSLQRLLNTPLATTPRHAAMIVSAVRSRLGFTGLKLPEGEMDGDAMDSMAFLGKVMAVDSVQQRQRRTNTFAQAGPIAIVPIHGTLTKTQEAMDPDSGMTGYNRIEQKIADAFDAWQRKEIKACWLDVDSGGGEVGGMLSLANFISSCSQRAGGMPIWAYLGDYGYSAAYCLASAADRVITSPTGGAGSVGVIALHADYSKAYAKEGITVTVLRSGKDKARANEHEPLEDRARDHLLEQMDEIRDLFAASVALFRGIDKNRVLETEGLDYMGRHARAIGFVDDVMWEQQAFASLLQLVS